MFAQRTITPVMPKGARIQPFHVIAANDLERHRLDLAAVEAHLANALANPDASPFYIAHCERQIAFHKRNIEHFEAALARIEAAKLKNINVRDEGVEADPVVIDGHVVRPLIETAA